MVVTPAPRRTKEIAASISEKFWGWQDYIDKKLPEDLGRRRDAAAVKRGYGEEIKMAVFRQRMTDYVPLIQLNIWQDCRTTGLLKYAG